MEQLIEWYNNNQKMIEKANEDTEETIEIDEIIKESFNAFREYE